MDMDIFRVSLYESQTDNFQRLFECVAEDEGHAAEQAKDAYPGCEVIWVAVIDDARG